jgi:hypothetical protein
VYLGELREQVLSITLYKTVTFPFCRFGETLAGGLTVGPLGGWTGDDVFTWILIVLASRGVVIS